jgi:hypothetical protein
MLRWGSVIPVLLILTPLHAGAAENDAKAESWLSQTAAGQPPGSRSRLAQRIDRRKACNQEATARSLSGRMARRYTRLCLSGLGPKPIGRSP